MSFSKKILLGLILGVAIGLFFGERIAFLGSWLPTDMSSSSR